MSTNTFKEFSIQYSEEPTIANFFKLSIVYNSDTKIFRVVPYFLHFDLAKDLTSKDENKVKRGIREYIHQVKNHIEAIESYELLHK